MFESHSEAAESNQLQNEYMRSSPQIHRIAFNRKFKHATNMQAGQLILLISI